MKNEFANRVGIWLDNSEAHLIEYNTDVMVSEVIKSKFTHEVMEESLEKSEYTMHNKKRQQQLSYFNEIAEEINNCKELLLFGPTEAKTKLENFLKADSHFESIRIFNKQTDYLTENQQFAFVKHFFLTNIS